MAEKKTPVADLHDDTPSFSDNAIGHGTVIDMEHYKATVPLWKRVWQHSLTQMMLLSIQAFCGPAMADAITGENDTPLLDSEATEGSECFANVLQASGVVVLLLHGCQTLRRQSHTPCWQSVCIQYFHYPR